MMHKNYLRFVLTSKSKKHLMEFMNGVWSGADANFCESFSVDSKKYKWKFKIEKIEMELDKDVNDGVYFLAFKFSFRTRDELGMDYIDYHKELPKLLMEAILNNRFVTRKGDKLALKLARLDHGQISLKEVLENVELGLSTKSYIRA